ncbi:SDR family NAD(P)-dependent oxidoreductase [Paenibacillus pinisoli]|uniref:SDR family NAD(P)-dependent oxidoreductase n=1 Tax=Paenibacillus pinisoli TaxID=1276110 RepID=A0A3A6PW12_9BACL|nr:SDR family NAD(P)-dependent oxidoreductase [Paenibacillus pinisoli]RJX38054.1 SDR family NAD(P)-dependent oxidoreductase [Paenibacillus pinisoli]
MRRYSVVERLLFPSAQLNEDKLAKAVQGKTVLITGASSGIGEQTALLLGQFPVHLVLVARREDKLMEVKSLIESKGIARATIVAVDMRRDEELEELLRLLREKQNAPDIVISNAGLSIRRSIFASLDRHHDYTRTMSINYLAPVKLLLSVIPELERRQGQVINVSTINTSLAPLPKWSAYQASKAAFDTWFRSAAPELNAAGIFTTSIYLPLVRTPMIEPTSAYKSMPAMNPEHVARIIAKSIYAKQTKWQPWWLFIGQAASLIFRGQWEKWMARKHGKQRGKQENG